MATAIAWFAAGALCVAGEEDLKIQEKPLSQWMTQLRGENRGFQMRAARVLAEAPTNTWPRIIEQVIPVLKSARENDKFVAAQVLGEYGPIARAAVPDLLSMLQGTEYERNRAAAAKALGQILENAESGEEIDRVAEALARKFDQDHDKYTDVRREAARAIGMIGPAAKKVIPQLDKALTDCQDNVAAWQDWGTRGQGAWACGRMGPLAAIHIDRLIAMMHEGNPESAEAVGRIGLVHENVLPNVIDCLEQGVGKGRWLAFRFAALGALERFGPKATPAAPLLIRWLRHPRAARKLNEGLPKEQMMAIARVLGAIGPAAKDALPYLEQMKTFENLAKWKRTPELQTVSDRLHEEAAKACAAIGGEGKAAPVGNDKGGK